MITLARPAQQTAFRYPAFEVTAADDLPKADDTAVVNGTECYCISTGITYKYDKENNKWYEKP